VSKVTKDSHLQKCLLWGLKIVPHKKIKSEISLLQKNLSLYENGMKKQCTAGTERIRKSPASISQHDSLQYKDCNHGTQ
jgi:hypothetical protein